MEDIKNTYTDSELILMIKQNDKRGFSYLYSKYAPALMYCIKKVVNDSHIAEDVLQDVFVSIWTKIESYDHCKSCMYTWMHAVARNKAIDAMRSSAQNMRNRTDELTPASTANYTGIETKTDKVGLSTMVGELTKDHKHLVCLAYYGGHTLTEISEHLQIPLGTVKTRLRAAIGLLRKEFAEPPAVSLPA